MRILQMRSYGKGFFLVAHAMHGGLEKENAKDGKHDEEFQTNQQHKHLSCGVLAKELPYLLVNRFHAGQI